MATVESRPSLEDADLSSRAFWNRPYDEREKVFARLRAECPVSWHRPYESTLMPPDEDTPGFWSITRYEDCREISRDAKRFINSKGVLMEDVPEVVLVASHSFLGMDGDEHRQQRGIVSTAFTPRNVTKIEDWIHQHVTELIDEMAPKGEGDFCELYAKQLPGHIFAHFFGVPKGSEEQQKIMDAAERMLAWDDPHCAMGRDALSTFAEEAEIIQDIALASADRIRESGERADNMVGWVLEAEFEGRKLEDWEIAAFFSLLGSAANDTTRHSIAHALRLLDAHPDQKELFLSDPEAHVDGLVEEVLRYATPVLHFRRTATEDVEIGGQTIAEGDKVVLWYCSGNRDEDAFENAGTFDITRDPNRHLGFGAGGPHYCIGASLGRQMVKSSMLELFRRLPDIRLDGDPVYQQNNFLHGVHEMPVRWTPPS